MFHHGPTPLTGPLTRDPVRWKQSEQPAAAERRGERPFRAELVARIRREIADGTYDTPEKFDLALERLLRRLEE